VLDFIWTVIPWCNHVDPIHKLFSLIVSTTFILYSSKFIHKLLPFLNRLTVMGAQFIIAVKHLYSVLFPQSWLHHGIHETFVISSVWRYFRLSWGSKLRYQFYRKW